MISDIDVYDRVARAISAEYTKAYIVSDRVYAPPTFPCVWIIESDSVPVRTYTALDFSDEQRRSVFEVQTFSNLESGASEQAKKIASLAKEEFRKLGYLCTSFSPIDNEDITIRRHFCRFERIIGGGDTLPT